MRRFIKTLSFLCVSTLILSACSSSENSPESNNKTPKKETAQAKNSENEPVTWQYDMQKNEWIPSRTAPQCKDPFVFDNSPVDMNFVTSKLLPGQSRGGNYKAHGGFSFDNRTDNKISVSMPYDAYLVGGARYIETGEIQYIFDFVSECGIAIRLDHLAALTNRLGEIANTLPEAQPNNSSGTKFSEPELFKAGEELATEVGFKNNLNVFVDFGVYDYRQQNDVSKNVDFQKTNGSFPATNYFGVCWFDLLPGEDAQKAKNLPSRDMSMGETSDYCK